MEFHGMKRKELQSLCKKHGIPANLKNVEMADQLASLRKVEDEKIKKQVVKPCLKNVEELCAIDLEVSEDKEQKRVRFSPQNETFEFEMTNPRAVRVATRRRNSMAIGEGRVSKEMNLSALEDVKGKGKSAANEQTKKQGVKNTRRGLGKRKLSPVDLVDPVSQAVDIKNSVCNESCVVMDLGVIDEEVSEGKEPKNVPSPQNQTFGFEKTQPRAVRASTRRRNSIAVGVDRITKENKPSALEDGKGKDRKNAEDEQTRKQAVKKTRCAGKRNLSSRQHVEDLETEPSGKSADLVVNTKDEQTRKQGVMKTRGAGKMKASSRENVEDLETEPLGKSADLVTNAKDDQTRTQGVKKTRCAGKRKASSGECVDGLETEPLGKTADLVVNAKDEQTRTQGVKKTRCAGKRKASSREHVDDLETEPLGKSADIVVNAKDEQTRKQVVKKTRCAGKKKASSREHVEDLENEPLGKSADLVDNSEVGNLENSVPEALCIQNGLCNDSIVVEDNQGKTPSLLQTNSPSPLLDKCNSKKDVEGLLEEGTLVKELEAVLRSPTVLECEPNMGEGFSMKSNEVEDRCEVTIFSTKQDEATWTNNNLEPAFCNLDGQVSREGMAEAESSPNINKFQSSMQKSGDATDGQLAVENEGYDQDAEEATPTTSINVDRKYSEAIEDHRSSGRTEYSAESVINHKHGPESILFPEAVNEEENDITAENDGVLSSKVPDGKTMTDVPDAEMGGGFEYSAEPDGIHKQGLEGALNSETIVEERSDMAAEDESVLSSKIPEERTVTDASDPEVDERTAYFAEPDVNNKQGGVGVLNSETTEEENSAVKSKGPEMADNYEAYYGDRTEYSAKPDVDHTQGLENVLNSENMDEAEERNGIAAESDSCEDLKSDRTEYSAERYVNRKQGLDGLLNSETIDEERNDSAAEINSVLRSKDPEQSIMKDVSVVDLGDNHDAYSSDGSEYPDESEISHKKGLECLLNSETINEERNCIAAENDSAVSCKVPEGRTMIGVLEAEMGDNHDTCYNDESESPDESDINHNQGEDVNEVLTSHEESEVIITGVPEERNMLDVSVAQLKYSDGTCNYDRSGYPAESDINLKQGEDESKIETIQEETAVHSGVEESKILDVSDAILKRTDDTCISHSSEEFENSAVSEVNHEQELEDAQMNDNHEDATPECNIVDITEVQTSHEESAGMITRVPEEKNMLDVSNAQLKYSDNTCNGDGSEYPAESDMNHKQGEVESETEPVNGVEETAVCNGVEETNLLDLHNSEKFEDPAESEVNREQGLQETTDSVVISIEIERRDMVDDVLDSQMNVNNEDAILADQNLEKVTAGDIADCERSQTQGLVDASNFQLALDEESYGIDTLNEDHEDAILVDQNSEKVGFVQEAADTADFERVHKQALEDESNFQLTLDEESYGMDTLFESGYVEDARSLIEVSKEELGKKTSPQRSDISHSSEKFEDPADSEVNHEQGLQETTDSVVISIELERRDMVDDVLDSQMNVNHEDAILADQNLEKVTAGDTAVCERSQTQGLLEMALDEESYGIDTLFESGYVEDAKSLIEVSQEELDKKTSPQRADIVLPLSSELNSPTCKSMPVPRNFTISNSKFNICCQSAQPLRSTSLDKLGMCAPVSVLGLQGTYNQKHEIATSNSMVVDYMPYDGDVFSKKNSATEEGPIQEFCNLESQIDIANVKSCPSPVVSNVIVETEEGPKDLGSNDAIVERIGTSDCIDNHVSATSLKVGDEENHSVDVNMTYVNGNPEEAGMPDQNMDVEFQEDNGKNLGCDQDAEIVSPTTPIIEKAESSEAIDCSITVKSENPAQSEAGQTHELTNEETNDNAIAWHSVEISIVPEGGSITGASSDQLNDNHGQKGDTVEYIQEVEEAATAMINGSSEVSESENPGNVSKCQRSHEQGLEAPNTSQLTSDQESYHIASPFQSEFEQDENGLIEELQGENLFEVSDVEMDNCDDNEAFTDMEIHKEQGALETYTDKHEISERLGYVGHSIDWEEFGISSQNKLDIALPGSEEKLTDQSSAGEKNSDEIVTCIESNETVEMIAPSPGCAEPGEDLIELAVFERFTEHTEQQTVNQNFVLTYEPEAEGADGPDDKELVHPVLGTIELDDLFGSANVIGISKEDESSPLDIEYAYAKLEKVENFEVIPGLVHPELSMAEIDAQCESANVNEDAEVNKLEEGFSPYEAADAELDIVEDETSPLNDEAAEHDEVEDEISPLNDEAGDEEHEKLDEEITPLDDKAADATAELDNVEDEISPPNDDAADTKPNKVENSSLKLKSMTNMKKRSILIHGTPIRPVNIADMKENSNVHLKRELNVGDATALRPLAKRKALGELHRS